METFTAMVKDAFQQRIYEILDEEVKIAQARVHERTREAVMAIVLQAESYYDIRFQETGLVITIKNKVDP